ncbi:MAG: polysaccharide biosynthesis C-terminal domain-containing protein [Coleofasciculus sp. S288]|nr:polysaccharide biosynthesis C-terminal domain-containing protein [Coleofasciculus sp. S288]
MHKRWGVAALLSAWNHLTTGSVNRKIFGAAVTVALFTALVKVAYVVQELVVAWLFGTGDAPDAFLVAFMLPTFLVYVVAESFHVALIPTYIQVREQEGLKAAQRLVSSMMLWSLGILGITTLLMVIAAPLYLPVIARGFSSEKLALTEHLLYTLAPLVILKGIAVIGRAVLNAGEKFIFAAFSPIVTPVLAVIFLLLGDRDWGIFPLAFGFVSGTALEVILLATALKKRGIGLHLRWCGFSPHMRQVASQYVPMVVGAFLMGSTTLVDQSMAAMLSPGSVAALNYGSKVVAFPLYLAATALGIAVVPYFSQMIAQADWLGVRHTLSRYLGLIFAITVPLTIILIIFSKPLVQALFQRGLFTAQDTDTVAVIQGFYALQLPFYIAGILVVRLISSIQANQILMEAAFYNLLANVILNYLFIQYLGVAGIALSTAIVYLISFIYCWFMLKKQIPKME